MYMITVTGRKINFIEPDINDIDIEDIATGLSNICRYSGQLKSFYSVAQHSVLVSRYAPDEYSLEGLLHDATEAYIGDVITPVKQYLPDYRRIEDNLMQVISKKFDLDYPFHPSIEHADKVLLHTEIRDLKPEATPLRPVNNKIETMPVTINPLSPNDAKKLFLTEFNYLMEKRDSERNQEKQSKRVRFTA